MLPNQRWTILPTAYCALSFFDWAILSFCVSGVDAEEGGELDHVCGFNPTFVPCAPTSIEIDRDALN